MKLEHRGEYPADWSIISRDAKLAVRYRCVRCLHPFHDRRGVALTHCDPLCDRARCKATVIRERASTGTNAHNLTVHHLDGDKANVAWWNLLVLCNSCHLTIQAKVNPEQPYMWEHSEWFKPYVAGFYAHYYGGLTVTREDVLGDLGFYLALGQPWLDECISPPPQPE